MLHFLPAPLRAIAALFFYFLNTMFWALPLIIFSLLKFCIRQKNCQNFFSKVLTAIADAWIGVIIVFNNIAYKIKYDMNGIDGLDFNKCYLVISNHQSWADILILQRLFHRRIPSPKFFLKKQLAWIPILGIAWWALDFPFMSRYSKKFLEKHPELKGKDLEVTRKACEKFKNIPVAVMNFVEGTRFTLKKQWQQKSTYHHLLAPKAGGIAYVLSSMGKQVNTILNTTIVYPSGIKNFWNFLCGKITEVKIRVEALPVPTDMIGDYFNDKEFRDRFQKWLNNLWQEKDLLIDRLLQEAQPKFAVIAGVAKQSIRLR